MSKKNLRKTAAFGLAFIGLAGVGVASAATLTLNGGERDVVQAGTDDLTADQCQGSVIEVSFTLDGNGPGYLQQNTEFGYAEDNDAILLDAIDGDCGTGKIIKVALGDDDHVLLGEEYEAPAVAGPLALSLADGGAFTDEIDTADIARVSVTIFDA